MATEDEIQISEEQIHKVGWIAACLAVLFIIIGVVVSPRDELGKPILLLPEVKAIEDYRQNASHWISELAVIDGEIDQLLNGDQVGDMFTQSRSAQSTLQTAVNLAQEIDRADIPTVGIGIHQQILTTSLNYLEAARSTVQWISAPNDENRDTALEDLASAQESRKELEGNQWINSQ